MPRRVPSVVWRICVLQVAMLMAYTMLVPAFRAPDEAQHVDLVRRMAQGRTYPRYDELRMSTPVVRAWQHAAAYQYRGGAAGAEEALGRSDRPSFQLLGPDDPSMRQNQLVQHPPLYYLGAGIVWRLADATVGVEGWAFDRAVWLLRALSVLLIAPLPLVLWAIARVLWPAEPRIGLAAALVPLAIPTFAHLGASATNDVLLLLLGAICVLVTTRVLSGDIAWCTAALLGAVTGLSLLTKGFALVLVPWIAGAYVFLSRRVGWRQAAGRLSLSLGVAFAFGGWWWLRNIAQYGRVQPTLDLREPNPPAETDAVEFGVEWLGVVTGSFWGAFGGLDVFVPRVLTVAATVTLVVMVLAAWRRGGGQRVATVYLLVPAALLLLLMLPHSWEQYERHGFPHASRGRYLFVALAGIAVAGAAGIVHVLGRRARAAPWAILTAAAVMHLGALATILSYFWAGDGIVQRLQAMAAWSPWPPITLWLAVGAVAASAWWTVLGLRRELGGTPEPVVSVASAVAET